MALLVARDRGPQGGDADAGGVLVGAVPRAPPRPPRSPTRGPSTSGKPWPRLIAPVRTASADISLKTVGGMWARRRDSGDVAHADEHSETAPRRGRAQDGLASQGSWRSKKRRLADRRASRARPWPPSDRLRRLLLLARAGVGLAGEVDRHGPRVRRRGRPSGCRGRRGGSPATPGRRRPSAHAPGRRRCVRPCITWTKPAASRSPWSSTSTSVLSWNAGLAGEAAPPAAPTTHPARAGRCCAGRRSSESNRARPMNQPVVGDPAVLPSQPVGTWARAPPPSGRAACLHLCGIGDRSLEHLHEHRCLLLHRVLPRADSSTLRLARGGPHSGPVHLVRPGVRLAGSPP